MWLKPSCFETNLDDGGLAHGGRQCVQFLKEWQILQKVNQLNIKAV